MLVQGEMGLGTCRVLAALAAKAARARAKVVDMARVSMPLRANASPSIEGRCFICEMLHQSKLCLFGMHVYIYIYIYEYTYILKGLRPMPPTRTLKASQTDSLTSGAPDTKDVINKLSGHTMFGQLDLERS